LYQGVDPLIFMPLNQRRIRGEKGGREGGRTYLELLYQGVHPLVFMPLNQRKGGREGGREGLP